MLLRVGERFNSFHDTHFACLSRKGTRVTDDINGG